MATRWGTEEAARAFDIIVSYRAPRGPKSSNSTIEGLQPLTEQVGSAEHLSIINVPLVARALVEGVPWRGSKVVRASLAEGKRALDRAENITLLSPAVRGDLGAGGEGGN